MERIDLELKPVTLFKDLSNHRLVMFIDKENKSVFLTAQVDNGVVFFEVNNKEAIGLNRYFGTQISMGDLSGMLLEHPDFQNLEYYLLKGIFEFYQFVFDNPEWFKDK